MITVNPDHSLSLTSGNSTQTFCEGDAIAPITYVVDGGATGASAVGLPLGLSSSFDGTTKVLTIQGTLSANVTGATTYTFDVTTTGNSCGVITDTVSLTITPDDEIGLDTSNSLQTLCEGDAIADIVYTLSGGATDATVIGLPNGVGYVVSGDELTIKGTPTDDIDSSQDYTYTVTTVGGCGPATATGTLTVNPEAIIELTSATGTDNQNLCEGTGPIVPITYELSEGGNTLVVNNLPPGLSYTFDSSNILTIAGNLSGDVSTGTTYTYEVVVSGGCGDGNKVFGRISIDADSELDLVDTNSANQTRCEGEQIAPIKLQLGGGAVAAEVTDLPSGLTTQYDASTRIFTISGSIAENITVNTAYTFEVKTTGNACATAASPEATVQITIEVLPKQRLELVSPISSTNQVVCEGTPIVNVAYDYFDGITKAEISWDQDPGGLTFSETTGVLTGTPTVNVTQPTTYNYTITSKDDDTSDGINNCVDQVFGTITINPLPEITPPSNNVIEVCEGQPIPTIAFAFNGANNAQVTGLPNGLTTQIVGNTIEISGTPTADISANQSFTYTVSTVGSQCGPEASETGTITLKADGELQASGSLNQTICEGGSITPVNFTWGGGAQGAKIVWATSSPSGISDSSITATNPLTLSGTLTGNVSTTTTYNYTVYTTDSDGCQEESLSGSITVKPNDEITLISGNPDQELCEGEPISNVTYQLGGGATEKIPKVTGLPQGISLSREAPGSDVWFLSGTLTADIEAIDPPYEQTFTITTTGGDCDTAKVTGTFTIKANAEINLVGSNNNQTLCYGGQLDEIVYTTKKIDSGDNILVVGLPETLFTYDFDPSTKELKINSIPELNVISAVDFTGNGAPTNSNPSSPSDGQIYIDQITGDSYKFVDPDPNGVGIWELINFAAGTYSYTIYSKETECNEAEVSGTITILPEVSIQPVSGINKSDDNTFETNTICATSTFDDIVLSTTGNVTDVVATNLPSGLEGQYNLVTNKFTIAAVDTDGDGIPGPIELVFDTEIINGVVYEKITNLEITVNTISDSGCNQDEFTFDLKIAPDPLKGLNTSLFDVTYCENETIEDIEIQLNTKWQNDTEYDFVLVTNDLPDGLIGVYDSNTSMYTISGTLADTSTGTYDIGLQSYGACERTSPVTIGTIKINPGIGYKLDDTSGASTQTLCYGSDISPISYTLNNVSTIDFAQVDWFLDGASVAPPNGISVTSPDDIKNTQKIEISGALNATEPITSVQNYEYRVSLFQGNCSLTFAGGIQFNPLASLAEPQIDSIVKLLACDESERYIKLGYIFDTDSDGIPDIADIDDDGDGIPDAFDIDNNPTASDIDGDDIIDAVDVDQTGGLDSGNNGIDDNFESNIPDADGDGIIDAADVDVTSGDDLNNDGIDDALAFNALTTNPYNHVATYVWRYAPDSDGNGIPDAADINNNPTDSDIDGDGIIDAADIDQNLTELDANGDNIVDAYLTENTFGLFASGHEIKNLEEGIYRVQVTSANGCDFTEDFTVASTNLEVKYEVIDETCGQLGSISIDSITPLAGYTIIWSEVGIDGTATEITSSIGLFEISGLEEGTYRLEIKDSNTAACGYVKDIEIQKDSYEIDNLNITAATICSAEDPATGLTLGSIEFNLSGTQPVDDYVLFKAPDADNDGIADRIDIDVNSSATDSDNDGIIDVADAYNNDNDTLYPGKTDANGDGIDDTYNIDLIADAKASASIALSAAVVASASAEAPYVYNAQTLALLPGTYVLGVAYNSVGNSCVYEIENTLVYVPFNNVSFDEDKLNTKKASLSGCSVTKSIDIKSLIKDPANQIDSYLWRYAPDSDGDGIPDAADLDQNPGSGDFDADGIIDAADTNQTSGPDVNADGIDDDYLTNNAFSLFATGHEIKDLENGIYRILVETKTGCVLEEEFVVTSSDLSVEKSVAHNYCGELGSIAIDKITPESGYDVYWYNISTAFIDALLDTDTDGVPDIADADQNPTASSSSGDPNIVDAAEPSTNGTDTFIDGIDDQFLLENVLRLNAYSNSFTLPDLEAGLYRLEVRVSGSDVCGYIEDIEIKEDGFAISNIATIAAPYVCPPTIDPETGLSMGMVSFDLEGSFMINNYLAYRAPDTDNDGIADLIDIDQNMGAADSDNDGIIDAADIGQTGGQDANGDGIDDRYNEDLIEEALKTEPILVPPTVVTSSSGEPYTYVAENLELIPGTYVLGVAYTNPSTTIACEYIIDDENSLITIANEGIVVKPTVQQLVCYDTPDASITVDLSNLIEGSNYNVRWTELPGPDANDYQSDQLFKATNTSKTLSARNLNSGIYKLVVWDVTKADCKYEIDSINIKKVKPVLLIDTEIDITNVSGNTVEFQVDGENYSYEVSNTNGGFVKDLSCDLNQEDGEIKVQILGNEHLSKEITWESYVPGDNCLTYKIVAIDSDIDGIPDYAEFEFNPTKLDSDGDGIIDAADTNQTSGPDVDADGIDDSYKVADLQYYDCSNEVIKAPLTHQILSGGGLTVCAKPNTVVPIENIRIEGGVQSCSLSSWEPKHTLSGNNYISGLSEGRYRLTVKEIDPENPDRSCVYTKTFEIDRDRVAYGDVTLDDALCEGNTGKLSIELIDFNGTPTFTYNGVGVTSTIEIDVINPNTIVYSFDIDLVDNPQLLISNDDGCSIVVDSELLTATLPDPDFEYTSESFAAYGVIPSKEKVRFEVTTPGYYEIMEWNFGDVTPLVYGSLVEHAFNTDGIYDVTLTVFNKGGCSKQITKQIRVGDGYTLLIPNVFTPNNDGINDVFEPKFSGFKTISMYVFDAYGNMLHESPESGGVDNAGDVVQPTITPWDGNNANNTNKMYIYRIIGTLVNDEVIEKSGSFQILR